MVSNIVARTNFLSPERHEEEAKHVKGGHTGTDGSHPVQQRLGVRAGIGFFEDQIFAVIARKTRNASNRDTSNQERPTGDGHLSQQTTHLANVLFLAHAVNHATRAEKEQGFEEGMSHQMKNTCPVRTDPYS